MQTQARRRFLHLLIVSESLMLCSWPVCTSTLQSLSSLISQFLFSPGSAEADTGWGENLDSRRNTYLSAVTVFIRDTSQRQRNVSIGCRWKPFVTIEFIEAIGLLHCDCLCATRCQQHHKITTVSLCCSLFMWNPSQSYRASPAILNLKCSRIHWFFSSTWGRRHLCRLFHAAYVYHTVYSGITCR